ncbi:helix-turn-helix domain-containing protein [Streptomyces sp. Ag109_G2-15]|uniref:helix-turn-helix domain-containing protein n=1 Tax=Streptomyces sp. Ag109_G2-15 TaxID=1938850 RepID=UPI000BD0EB54|nr:helix-turn-helix domain-containing protein [Streptomyces sp. Ag109_G2-15]SOD82172.1 AraC-type DNA-binding protein [Streptomyces sp. Ag109_G2-15]
MTAHVSSPGTDELEITNITSTSPGGRRTPPVAGRQGLGAGRRYRSAADHPAAPETAEPGEFQVPVRAAVPGPTERHQVDLGSVRLSLLSLPVPPAVLEMGRYAGGLPLTWHLVFAPRGPLVLGRDRRLVRLESGSVVLWEAAEPFRLSVGASAGSDEVRALVLHLPEAALPLPGKVLRDVSGRPTPTGSGPAALLASFVFGLATHLPSAEDRHAAWLGTAAVNLATAFLDSETARLQGGWTGPRPAEPLPPRPHPVPPAADLLLDGIKTYIEHHLHDPDLSPTSIAAANHISLRYLHHVFQRDGLTVGAFLRERRLEHCRTDLSDPAKAQRSVCDIARRWGFRDPAVFNRTFKSVYGVTPGSYRRQRLRW